MNNISRKHTSCPHDVFLRGLCGNCGAHMDPPQSTSISMVHSIPELKVSKEYAKEIGKADQERLIEERKLVLVVDLDQTVLHTTHEEVRNDPNVHSFTLWPGHPTYYTKLRPHLKEFLEEMHRLYELHIFTFGCRKYAHKIASIIDPTKEYFGNRILSRDESVDQYSKKENLNNLFPCGDAMVCIIDDRSDVWRDAGNLIQVKPYSYFKTSIGDGASRRSATTIDKFEDDEALKRGADQLEALVDISCEEVESNEVTGNQNESSAENETNPTNETNDADDNDETDNCLLFLSCDLTQIHENWYSKLDEERRFLADGESYKLPDIKDIISLFKKNKRLV